MESETPFRDTLFAAGLLIPTGVDGLYGRSGEFERVVDGLEGMVTRLGAADGAEVMRFPPGLSRSHFERTGYLKGFPASGRHHPLLLRRRARPPRGAPLPGGRGGLDRRAARLRHRADPGRLLPDLPGPGGARHAAAGRRAGRRVILLLPPRAVAGADPAADVPPARARADRHRGGGRPLPARCGWRGARRRCGRCICRMRSRSPTTRSSADPAGCWQKASGSRR